MLRKKKFYLFLIVLLNFFKFIIKNQSARSVLQILLWAFPLFCVINFSLLQSFYDFNTYSRPGEAIIFIALSMIYWWQDHEEYAETSWTNISTNWFVTGLMLYFAGSFFLFLFSNYLLTIISVESRKNVSHIAWNTHGTFMLIMYLLIAVGFMKCKK